MLAAAGDYTVLDLVLLDAAHVALDDWGEPGFVYVVQLEKL